MVIPDDRYCSSGVGVKKMKASKVPDLPNHSVRKGVTDGR